MVTEQAVDYYRVKEAPIGEALPTEGGSNLTGFTGTYLYVTIPYQVPFSFGLSDKEALAKGATARTDLEMFQAFLNPAFVGKTNWDALSAALAAGDAYVRLTVSRAFDQLYLASASGTYLNAKANDYGIVRPWTVGMSDDIFRKLSIALNSEKLTQNSFFNVLEVLYGEDSVRAYIETELSEPFGLYDGVGLRLLIDETEAVDVIFKAADFVNIQAATAQEVVASISRQLEDGGSTAYATDFTDAQSGAVKVRIYSGSRGLGSSVRIWLGTAQPFLGFPEEVDFLATGWGANSLYWAVEEGDEAGLMRLVPRTYSTITTQAEPGDNHLHIQYLSLYLPDPDVVGQYKIWLGENNYPAANEYFLEEHTVTAVDYNANTIAITPNVVGTWPTATTLVTVVPQQFNNVEAGDYIVALDEFTNAGVWRGAYKVTDVLHTSTPFSPSPYIEVYNPNGHAQAGFSLQTASGIKVYKSRKATIIDNPLYSFVSQGGGRGRISIPVTTQAVVRGAGSAAYLKGSNSYEITDILRNLDDTVQFTVAPGVMNEDGWFFLDGFSPDTYEVPYPTLRNSYYTDNPYMGTYDSGNKALGKTHWCRHSDWSRSDQYPGLMFGQTMTDSFGDLLVVGPAQYSVWGESGLLINYQQGIHSFRATQYDMDTDGEKSALVDYRRSVGTQFAAGIGCLGCSVSEVSHYVAPGSLMVNYGYLVSPWEGGYHANLLTLFSKNDDDFIFLSSRQIWPIDDSHPEGITSALGFRILLGFNTVSGDVLTVKNGSATRTYGFGTGGNVTVTIGADARATMANLVTSINGDASANWKAEACVKDGDYDIPMVAISEKTATGSKSTLRIYGTFSVPANFEAVHYSDDVSTDTDYSRGTGVQVPTSDPGATGRAGPNKIMEACYIYTVGNNKYIYRYGNDQQHFGWRYHMSTPYVRNWGLESYTDTGQYHYVSDFDTRDGETYALAEAAQVTFYDEVYDNEFVVFLGGCSKTQTPTTDISVWNSHDEISVDASAALNEARCQAKVVKLDEGHALLIGGRSPGESATGRVAFQDRDTILSYLYNTSSSVGNVGKWSFEEETGAPADGPVEMDDNGTPQTYGKIGWGRYFDSESVATSGTAQDDLNEVLTYWNYAITWWQSEAVSFTESFPDAYIMKCGLGAGESWASPNDNTLFEFGYDSNEDKFYLCFEYGAVTQNTERTYMTQTVSELFPNPTTDPPQMHHFAVVAHDDTWGTSRRLFKIYIDGVLVDSWSGKRIAHDGSDALWRFGASGCTLDEVTITKWGSERNFGHGSASANLRGLTATEIAAIYAWECGTLYPTNAIGGLDNWKTGRVLNSSELVTLTTNEDEGTVYFTIGTYYTNAMAYSRFAFGALLLPNGEVLVAGGIGYKAGRDTAECSKTPPELELRSAEIYNPDARQWRSIPDMIDAHSYPAIGYDEGTNRVYVMGGFSSNRAEYLDLNTMTWHLSINPERYWVDDEPVAVPSRAMGQGGVINGVLAFIGGAPAPAENVNAETDGRINSGDTYDSYMVINGETLWAGGINGLHKATYVAEDTSGVVQFTTPGRSSWTQRLTTGATITPVSGLLSSSPDLSPIIILEE